MIKKKVMPSTNKIQNVGLSDIIDIQKKSLEVSEVSNKLVTRILDKGRFSEIKENILLFIIALNCCFSLVSLIK